MLELVTKFVQSVQERPKRILVIGDAMTDRYYMGIVGRISPESPCPVFQQTSCEDVPGGAKNVVRQLEDWCQVRGFYSSASCVKSRYVVNGQIVFRADLDESIDCESSRDLILNEIWKEERCDTIILSDYDKGLLDAPFIEWIVHAYAKRRAIPVIADHKRRPLREWSGVSVLKMNHSEWASHITEHHNGDVVVTWGNTSPTVNLCTDIGPKLDIPVKSTCGAGDCFTAFLALAIAHGFSTKEAAAIAHLAGGAYVQHEMNLPILPHELIAMADPIEGKIVTSHDCRRSIDHLHKNRIVYFTNGVFDLLHAGHAKMLQWTKAQGGIVVVGVNSDRSAKEWKGKAPICNEFERARSVAALPSVDYVVAFDAATPTGIMGVIKPDVLVKGPEYYLSPQKLPGSELVGKTITAPVSNCVRHSIDLRDGLRADG